MTMNNEALMKELERKLNQAMKNLNKSNDIKRRNPKVKEV